MTLVTRQVLLSLFQASGSVRRIWWAGTRPPAAAHLQLVMDSVTESFNSKLLLFTFLSGAMLGMIFLSGGMQALAQRIISRIQTRKQAELGRAFWG